MRELLIDLELQPLVKADGLAACRAQLVEAGADGSGKAARSSGVSAQKVEKSRSSRPSRVTYASKATSRGSPAGRSPKWTKARSSATRLFAATRS